VSKGATLKIPQPVITKEHGAWAVLLVPLIVGASSADRLSPDVLFLAVSALSFFLGYVPIEALLRERFGVRQGAERVRQFRFWAAVYIAAGILFAIPLLALGYWLLLPISCLGAAALIGAYVLTRVSPKSVGSDLVAVAGLTLTGPASYYVATGSIGRAAVMLWLFSFLFFGCGVFYVHMKIRAAGKRKRTFSLNERLSLGGLNLAYHLAVIFIVGVFIALHFTIPIVLVAFVPVTIHAIVGTIRLSGQVQLKKLGLLLLGQAGLFGLFLIAAEHLP